MKKQSFQLIQTSFERDLARKRITFGDYFVSANVSDEIKYQVAWQKFYKALKKHGIALRHFGLNGHTKMIDLCRYLEDNFRPDTGVDVVRVLRDRDYAKKIAQKIIQKSSP